MFFEVEDGADLNQVNVPVFFEPAFEINSKFVAIRKEQFCIFKGEWIINNDNPLTVERMFTHQSQCILILSMIVFERVLAFDHGLFMSGKIAPIDNKGVISKLEGINFFSGINECRLQEGLEGDITVEVNLLLVTGFNKKLNLINFMNVLFGVLEVQLAQFN